MSTQRLLAAVVTLLALPATPIAAQSADPQSGGYTLGSGLPIGGSGIRLGGYLTIDAENPDNEHASLTFDDVSLFVFGDVASRGHFFIEAEETHFWTIDSTGRIDARNNADLERLYFDYLHNDALKIRVGKFLTPVGTWNEIHPDPLTWTVSRPLASYATFPAFTTGVQGFGTWSAASRDVDYNVFVQHNPSIDRSTGERHTERMIGGRIRVRQSRLEIGVPLMRYRERETGAVATFSGADLLARSGRLEVRGELTAGRIREANGRSTAEYAAYLQGMWSLIDRFFIVGRQERAHSRDELTFSATSGGLLFRPMPAMSFKIEYQARSGRFFAGDSPSGNQALASFGVLF